MGNCLPEFVRKESLDLFKQEFLLLKTSLNMIGHLPGLGAKLNQGFLLFPSIGLDENEDEQRKHQHHRYGDGELAACNAFLACHNLSGRLSPGCSRSRRHGHRPDIAGTCHWQVIPKARISNHFDWPLSSILQSGRMSALKDRAVGIGHMEIPRTETQCRAAFGKYVNYCDSDVGLASSLSLRANMAAHLGAYPHESALSLGDSALGNRSHEHLSDSIASVSRFQ